MTRFEADLRTEAAPNLDVGDEPELVSRLHDEIAASGPITFARFMERALYEPHVGYYARPSTRPGRAGDFLTAPETHPVFGWAVARQLDEIWQLLERPDPFVVREHGAGSGALGQGILDGLRRERSALINAIAYQPVEIEAEREAAIRARLEATGHGHAVRRAAAPAGTGAAGRDSIVGVVLANEVLDALPVHRVVVRAGRLREILVDWRDSQFVEVEADPTTPRIEERLRNEGITLADGQQAELSLAIDDWVAAVAAELRRGVTLLIDYGYPAAELYDPKRRRGTLLAYVRHRAHEEVFTNVGRQDLTAHVDLTAVERAADQHGLRKLGLTTQAEFLVGVGLADMLESIQRDPATSVEDYLGHRSSVVRLLDPAATGKFAVMAFGRGVPDGTQLRGFSFRLAHRGGKSNPG
jgi:SAM-dependent MidA family methyltransferase